MKRRIRLRGINGEVEGKPGNPRRLSAQADWRRWKSSWKTPRSAAVTPKSDPPRRAGAVRDLGSTNGTFLNGTRLGPGEWAVRPMTSSASATSPSSSMA